MYIILVSAKKMKNNEIGVLWLFTLIFLTYFSFALAQGLKISLDNLSHRQKGVIIWIKISRLLHELLFRYQINNLGDLG